MSKERVLTMLEGYKKQIFPSTLDALNERYDEGGFSGSSLQKKAEQIEGFVVKDRPKTTDGYYWFWGLHFLTKARILRKPGKVAILFPWAQDWNRREGFQSDRSIAIYTTGNVTSKEAEEIAKKVLEVL